MPSDEKPPKRSPRDMELERVGTDVLNRLLWFDVAPRSPRAFQDEPLFDFIEAEDTQRAWKLGIERADEEAAGKQRSR